MRKYLATIKYGLQYISAYKSETFAMIVFKLIKMAFLVLLYGYVLRGLIPDYSTHEILSYLLIVNAIQVITGIEFFRGARRIGRDIYSGVITNILIKPVNVPVFEYLQDRGERGVEYLLALVEFAGGVALSLPALSVLPLFVLSVLIAIVLSYGLNLIVGSITFWTTEQGGIKNGFSHAMKIFGGTLIPLNLLPPVTQTLVLLTPFPYAAYLPTRILQGGFESVPVYCYFIAVAWAILALILGNYLWKKGLKRYEAIGI